MPTLKIPRKELYDNNFINAFLGDIDKEDYHKENIIFLLFKPENISKFRDFLRNQYEENKFIIDDYDYNPNYIVIIYNLNNDLENDFKLIKEGKYSKTSEKFKKIFPKKIKLFSQEGHPDEDSLQWMIFNKDKRLIDYIENIIDSPLIGRNNLEIWPIFNPKNEILDIESIIENEKTL